MTVALTEVDIGNHSETCDEDIFRVVRLVLSITWITP